MGSAISGQILAFDPDGGILDVSILGSLRQGQCDLKLVPRTHVIRFESSEVTHINTKKFCRTSSGRLEVGSNLGVQVPLITKC